MGTEREIRRGYRLWTRQRPRADLPDLIRKLSGQAGEPRRSQQSDERKLFGARSFRASIKGSCAEDEPQKRFRQLSMK